MGRVTKGMTLIEVMIVVLLISILTSIAMPMYNDYTMKARTSEVPMTLKSLAETQIGYFETEGNYACALLTLGWKTNIAFDGDNTAVGSFYEFSTANNPGCNPGSGDDPEPNGLAIALAKEEIPVPPNFQAACMDASLAFRTNGI